MKNLLNFLIKYNYWFLFIFLEVISFILLIRFNNYQGSTFFTSANGVVGSVYKASDGIVSYFHLKTINRELLERNILLEQQLVALENELFLLKTDSSKIELLKKDPLKDYNIIKANVINNSLNRVNNYITLDRGSKDGIKNEMGVIDGNGVVGIVYMTSNDYSVVISVLNTKSSISCKIKGSEYFGYLKWEGGDSQYAYVKDLPRHAEFAVGDTVVTSGYSAVFPSGVMVGTIENMEDSHDGLSYLLRIKLETNFGKLGEVRVISKHNYEEQKELEQRANK